VRSLFWSGGEEGIRTLGTLAGIAGFQDRFLKPLGHLSTLAERLFARRLLILSQSLRHVKRKFRRTAKFLRKNKKHLAFS
jgi:hypothetical protein